MERKPSIPKIEVAQRIPISREAYVNTLLKQVYIHQAEIQEAQGKINALMNCMTQLTNSENIGMRVNFYDTGAGLTYETKIKEPIWFHK